MSAQSADSPTCTANQEEEEEEEMILHEPEVYGNVPCEDTIYSTLVKILFGSSHISSINKLTI